MPTIEQNKANLAANLSALKAGATSFDSSGNWIAPKAATPAPIAAPVTTTVPPRTPGLLESAQNEAANLANTRRNAQREADSYAATQRQARIDAINQTFAPRISREKEEGDARLSRVAALNLKSGIVGSGVDTTKSGEQKTQNSKALQALEDEKAMAINEAFGWADELARQRAEDSYTASKEDAEANVAMYKERADLAMDALKVFGAQGTTAETLKTADPKTYETLRDVSGMSDAQIDAYLKVNAPEGTYQWSAAQIDGSTMYVPKVVNGVVTMDKVDMGFTPATEKKVNSTVKTDDGVLVIYSDGTYATIGGGNKTTPGTQTLKEDAPTFEEYAEAAHQEIHKTLGKYESEKAWTDEDIAKLREEYNRAYMVTNNSDFTATEKKKLEQAGLLSATRQEQLDFLYADDSSSIDFGSAE